VMAAEFNLADESTDRVEPPGGDDRLSAATWSVAKRSGLARMKLRAIERR
jgi:hypothetical protein